MERILVAGAGVFGVTAAIELRKRGHPVALIDPGPLPHPVAAATDISKVVRVEYGADEAYTALAEKAIEGWKRWNEELGERLYHETGLLLLRQSPLAPGTIEQDSFEVLSRRGHAPERIDAAQVRARFPAWNADRYPHGTYSRQGGFVESGRVIARLVEEARRLGVQLREGAGVVRGPPPGPPGGRGGPSARPRGRRRGGGRRGGLGRAAASGAPAPSPHGRRGPGPPLLPRAPLPCAAGRADRRDAHLP